MPSEVKLKLDQKITNILGQTFKRKVKDEDVDVTLGFAIMENIGSATNVDGQKSLELYKILKKVRLGGEKVFDKEEIVALMEILKTCSAMLYVKGQMLDMLEEALAKDEKPPKE